LLEWKGFIEKTLAEDETFPLKEVLGKSGRFIFDAITELVFVERFLGLSLDRFEFLVSHVGTIFLWVRLNSWNEFAAYFIISDNSFNNC